MTLDIEHLIRRHMVDPNVLRNELATHVMENFTWIALDANATLTYTGLQMVYTGQLRITPYGFNMATSSTPKGYKGDSHLLKSDNHDSAESAIQRYANVVADSIVAFVASEIKAREQNANERTKATDMMNHLTTRHPTQKEPDPT